MDLAFAGFGQDPSAFASAAVEYKASAASRRDAGRLPRQPMAAPALPAPSAALEALAAAVGDDLAQGREHFHAGGLQDASALFRRALARAVQASRSAPSTAAPGSAGAPVCAVDVAGARAGARLAACAVRAAGNMAACAMAAGQAKEAHWLGRRALGIWAGASVAASLAGTADADGTPAVSPQGLPKAMVVRLVRCCVRLGEAQEAKWAIGTLPRLVEGAGSGAAGAAAAEGGVGAEDDVQAAVMSQLGAEVAALEAADEAAAAVTAAAAALPRSSAVAAQVCSSGPLAAASAMDHARDAAWKNGSEEDVGAVTRQGEQWRRWLASGASALSCLVSKAPSAAAGGAASIPALLSGSAGSLAAVLEAGSEPWAAATLAAAAAAGAAEASASPDGSSDAAAGGGGRSAKAEAPAAPSPSMASAAELSLRLVEVRAKWSAEGERAAAKCAAAMAELVPALATDARGRHGTAADAGPGGDARAWSRRFCVGARAADLGCEAALEAAEMLHRAAARAMAAHAEREQAELEEDSKWVAAACLVSPSEAAARQVRSAVRAGRLGAAGQAAAVEEGAAAGEAGRVPTESTEERELGAVADAAAALAKTARAVLEAAAAADSSDAIAASSAPVTGAERRSARSAAGERLGVAVREAAAGGLLSVAAATALAEACRSLGAGAAAGLVGAEGEPEAGAERAKEWCVTAVALRPRSAAARVCAGCALWALKADAVEAGRWVRGALAATRCFEGLKLVGATGGAVPAGASGGGIGWAARPHRRAADWAISRADVVGCSNATIAEAWQVAEGGWGDMAGAAARMALRSAASHPGPLASLLGAALGAVAAVAEAAAQARRAKEARAASEAAAAARAEAEAARRRAQRQQAREAEQRGAHADGGAASAKSGPASAGGAPDAAAPMPGSHYHLLGVPFGAAETDIKRAYRRLARTLHPDKASRKPGATEQSVKQAEEKFKAVTSAYETLCDPPARADYDSIYKQAQEAARRAQAAAVAASARAAPARPADPIRRRRPRRPGAY